MSKLILGEKQRYEISKEMIEKYNIKKGTISPYTGLRVIELDDKGSDIKEITPETGSDIKEIATGSDIKEIAPDNGSDIKEI